jgi:hypothetical protein
MSILDDANSQIADIIFFIVKNTFLQSIFLQLSKHLFKFILKL